MDMYQLAGAKTLKLLGIFEPNLNWLSRYYSVDEIVGTALLLFREENQTGFLPSERLSQKFFIEEENYHEILNEYSNNRRFAERFVIIDDDVPIEVYNNYVQLARKVMIEPIRSSDYKLRTEI